MSLNKVQLIGNLGRDPEIRVLNSGDKVANFSVATSERWKDKTSGEKKEKTEWHNVVVYGALAGVVEKYLSKGSKVYVEGKMTTRKWEKDGVDRYTTEVIMQNLEMLDGADGSKRDDKPDDRPPSERGARRSGDMDDNIPF